MPSPRHVTGHRWENVTENGFKPQARYVLQVAARNVQMLRNCGAGDGEEGVEGSAAFRPKMTKKTHVCSESVRRLLRRHPQDRFGRRNLSTPIQTGLAPTTHTLTDLRKQKSLPGTRIRRPSCRRAFNDPCLPEGSSIRQKCHAHPFPTAQMAPQRCQRGRLRHRLCSRPCTRGVDKRAGRRGWDGVRPKCCDTGKLRLAKKRTPKRNCPSSWSPNTSPMLFKIVPLRDIVLLRQTHPAIRQ